MGRYDLVEQVLAEMHAEFLFTGANIQPGRPVVFGRILLGANGLARHLPKRSYKYFFGLPGNPVSTMVTFELFARPMIEALAGMSTASARIPPRSFEIGNPRQARTQALPSRHSFGRVRRIAR